MPTPRSPARRTDGGYSSVGRAPDCGSGCRGFKPLYPPSQQAVPPWGGAPVEHALVAQLDRAPDFESVGRRFNSCRVYSEAARRRSSTFQPTSPPCQYQGHCAGVAPLSKRLEGLGRQVGDWQPAAFHLPQRGNAYQPRVQPWGWDGGHASGTRTVGMHPGHGRWACIRDTDDGHASGTRTVGMHPGHGRWECIRDTDGGYASGTRTVGMHQGHR